MSIRFFVYGKPQQQGSARGFVVGNRAVITSANRNLKPWRNLVSSEAQKVAPARLMEGPIKLGLNFIMPRPKSAPKTRVILPDKRPDLDKLVRGILDALTNVIYHDDSQVTAIMTTKRYDYTQSPGVEIVVMEDSL